MLREAGQGVGSRKIIDCFQLIPSWHPALQDLNSRKLPTGKVWIVLCYRCYCFALGQRLGKDLFYEPTYSLQLGSRDLVRTMLRSSPRCWELIFKGGCLIRSDRISVHRRNPLCVCMSVDFSCLQYDPFYPKSPRSTQINPSEPE